MSHYATIKTMNNTAEAFVAELKKHVRRASDAEFLQRFFKAGPGEYGEGDVFVGVRVPNNRLVCRQFKDMPLGELEKMLESPVHEVRLGAVMIMADQAKRAKKDLSQREALFNLYLRRTDRINNWDIVDASCAYVVGGHLFDRPRDQLYYLAHSQNIWERRIAIVSTWYFIRQGQLDDTFAIAGFLLKDKQDLIHKAVGWMLREAGKKDAAKLRRFLNLYAAAMPRTALRYAIEHFSPEERQHYMAMKKASNA